MLCSKSILVRMNVSLKWWFTSYFLYWQPVYCRHTSQSLQGPVVFDLHCLSLLPAELFVCMIDRSFSFNPWINLLPFHRGQALPYAWNFPLLLFMWLAHLYLQNLFKWCFLPQLFSLCSPPPPSLIFFLIFMTIFDSFLFYLASLQNVSFGFFRIWVFNSYATGR